MTSVGRREILRGGCPSTPSPFDQRAGRPLRAGQPELLRYEPSPVVEANRAVAVAMAEGPAAGLVILDAVATHPQLRRWPQLHVARAELLRRLDRGGEAAEAYRLALQLEPPGPERAFIKRRLAEIATGTP